LLSLPRQQAAAKAKAEEEGDEEEEPGSSSSSSSSSSFFALCYADAGVSESLRSLGVDAEALASEASVALLCDLKEEEGGGEGKEGREEEAMKAVSTAAALWRGRCGFQTSSKKQQQPGHLFVLLSSSGSLDAAAGMLRAHAGWAIGGGGDTKRTRKTSSSSSSKTTILVSPALSYGPRALAALAASLEDAAGLKRRSLSGGGGGGGGSGGGIGGGGGGENSNSTNSLQQLRGCEWSLAGARPSWFVLPEKGEAAELSRSAWPLVPEEDEEEKEEQQQEPSSSSSSKAAAVAAAAAFSTAAALSAGAVFQAGMKLDPFVVGTSPAARSIAEAVIEARKGEADSSSASSSLLARAAKAAAAAASSLASSSATEGGHLRRAALVLVDARSFSAGAALHDDHPLSRALCCCLDAGKGAGNEGSDFPRRHGSDVEVSISSPSSISSSSSLFLPPSSLLDAADPWVDSLACRRSADAALLLRKWLREAARAAGVPVPARGRAGSAPPSELKSLVEALSAAARARVSRSGRRARALAWGYAEAALSGERWERAAEAEKRLLGLLEEGGDDDENERSHNDERAHSAAAAAVSAVADELAAAFRCAASGENDSDAAAGTGTGAALADALLLAAVGASVVADLKLKSSSSSSCSSSSPTSFSSLFGEEDAFRVRGEALAATLSAYEAAVRASKEVKRELAGEGGWRPTKEKKKSAGTGGESESNSSLAIQVERFVDSFLGAAARAAGARSWLPEALRTRKKKEKQGDGEKAFSLSPAAEIVSHVLRREPVPGVGSGGGQGEIPAVSAGDDDDDDEHDNDDNERGQRNEASDDDDDDGGPSLRSLLRGALAGAAATGFSTPPKVPRTTKSSTAAAPSQQQLRIADYDDVVLFFVGGLSVADARAVAAAVVEAEAGGSVGGGGDDDGGDDEHDNRGGRGRPAPRVVLGGSRLVGPGEVYRGMLGGVGVAGGTRV